MRRAHAGRRTCRMAQVLRSIADLRTRQRMSTRAARDRHCYTTDRPGRQIPEQFFRSGFYSRGIRIRISA
jgi:hypothetical protein